MGDKNPKTTHKQATQKQAKADAKRQQKSTADAVKRAETPKK